MIPGEILAARGDIELNPGRATRKLSVANTGDRPIQVGSHYHFFETNDAFRAGTDARGAAGQLCRRPARLRISRPGHGRSRPG